MAEVIAELATNHGGDLNLAARMIAEAKKCGADYAKVQAYQTKFLRPGDPQEAWFKQAELSEEGLRFLKRVCDDEGIKFLATVFDPERVPLIRELSDEIKIGSGEASDSAIAGTITQQALRGRPFRRIFVGAGLFDPMDFEHRCDAIFCSHVMPMFGVSDYPVASTELAIEVIRLAAGRMSPFGYSDHALELTACAEALRLNASFIEVHTALAVPTKRLLCEKTSDELSRLCSFAKDGIHGSLDLNDSRCWARRRYVGRWAHGR